MSPTIPLAACLPRSAGNLKAALDSLNVDTDPKYLPHDVTGDGVSESFCNCFVHDACELLGAPLPKNLRAREQIAFLNSFASREAGWAECSKTAADVAALAGQPVIVGWVNPNPAHSSHIAMLRAPGLISQAGASNFKEGSIARGFGDRQVRYWSHS